jgi:ABC-2 type transport system ATP-binding protein
MLETSTPVLEVESLTKRFGKHAAVNELSFSVNEGYIFGFLGPIGAGKSTTMYMMAGLVRPTSGNIRVFGHPHTHVESVRTRMGTMIEIPAFYEYLSGRKNLQVLATIQGGVPKTRVDEVLDLVGLLDRGKDRVREYSHGMKQRLGIAQALLHRPSLLLLDEPTNGLDPEGSAQVWDLLRRLVAEERMTIFISSHLLHEVEEWCNRIAVINQGILVACDEVRRLLFFSKEDSLLLFDSPGTRDDARNYLDRLSGVEVLSEEASAGYASSSNADENSLYVRMQQGLTSEVLTELVSRKLVPRAVVPQRKTLKQFFLELTRRQH